MTMKVGDLIRPRRLGGFQIFDGIINDWVGLLIRLEGEDVYGPKYRVLHVLLPSHGNLVKKSWLTDSEIRENIEVVG